MTLHFLSVKNTRAIRLGAFLLLALPALLGRLAAGEIVLTENFDALKLNELPPEWTKMEPTMLSMVDEEGRGKVLKIANSDERYAALVGKINPAKAAGKIVRVTVFAKFPGTYETLADKLWAAPKVLIDVHDAADKSTVTELVPQQHKPEWQERKADVTIPPGAKSVTVSLCVQFVTATVYFDNLTLEIVGDAPAAVPPPPAPVAPAAQATPAAPGPPAPAAPLDPDSPAGRAAKAPKKALADDGISFGPDFALNLQKIALAKKAAPNTILFVGPGIGEKDPLPKLSSGWTALPLAPKLTGHSATPRHLLEELPKFLLDKKPEVVLLAGDEFPGRKPSSTEAEDWEDVASLCARMGAVPIIAVQPLGAKDEALESIRAAIHKALDIDNLVALSPQPAELYPRRVSALLTLLDRHVFLRGKADDAKSTTIGTPGKVQDE